MTDYLYYWQRYAADVASGPIFKLNQNSPTMQKIAPGDDVWAFSLTARGLYDLTARFTVTEVGINLPASVDRAEYGEFYFRSSHLLANYMTGSKGDFETVVRLLSVRCEGEVLGQCF